MTVAVLAEKPSVARDIARVLGAGERGKGCLRGNGYAVTWALGHLVGLCQPHEIQPGWRHWRAEQLPMIPDRWPLSIEAETRQQFEAVSRILNDPGVREVICATDAGREGELIFRYIYEAAECRKPVRRLWISSLTRDAIRDGFAALREGGDFDNLAAAARGRSRADWLVGMNLSRAYTLAYTRGRGDTLSVGRVQTPTLAMLVERETAIRDFAPEAYREVVATFGLRHAHADATPEAPESYRGVYFRDTPEEPAPEAPGGGGRPSRVAPAADESRTERSLRARRLPAEGDEAPRIADRALTGEAEVESLETRRRSLPPPLLYDLTELQRHANRLFGYSAKRTLEIAQSLYERKKLLSYPRTDSRHLSRSVAATLGEVVRAVAGPYRDRLAPGTGERPLGSRYVNDARVGDHHALIPTTTTPSSVSLSRDEQRIYDLVCRRLLAAWHEDHVYSTTTAITRIRNPGPEPGDPDIVDRYHSTGTQALRAGWKILDPTPPRPTRAPAGPDAAASAAPDPTGTGPEAGADGAETQLPPTLATGQPVDVLDARIADRKTRPPRPFTEASLLTAMETAGRTLDDRELSDAMRESGLGTPATRAAIIETLLARSYVERRKKSLRATDKGIRLIEVVHESVKSPAMTGHWEARLRRIEQGSGDFHGFMREIESYVGDVVKRVRAEARPAGSRPPAADSAPRRHATGPPGSRSRRRASPAKRPHGAEPDPRAGSRETATSRRLAEALREWRLATAHRHGIPAFRVLSDRTLLAIAAAAPADQRSLLAVKGIGPTLARRHGQQILSLVRRHRSASSPSR